jgi:ATP-dependent 26S proteasome regulatory subunit
MVLLAATNEASRVDPAVLGRFDRVVTLQALRTCDEYRQVLTALPDPEHRLSGLDFDRVSIWLAEHFWKVPTGASVAQLLFRARLEADLRASLVTERDLVAVMGEEDSDDDL